MNSPPVSNFFFQAGLHSPQSAQFPPQWLYCGERAQTDLFLPRNTGTGDALLYTEIGIRIKKKTPVISLMNVKVSSLYGFGVSFVLTENDLTH